MAVKRRLDKNGRILKKGEAQREDGRYIYRWQDKNKKQKCFYAKTLEELRKKENTIQKEILNGVIRTSITLNEQIERYLDTKVNLAMSTLNNYRYYYGHCIQDSWFGKKKVSDIKKSDVLSFYKELSEEEYSAGTIKIIHKIIHPALKLACDDDIIMKNPSDGCIREYGDRKEKKYALTMEEETEFLERIKSSNRFKLYYPMYAIMLQTGLRISEMIGLTWEDINMEERTININHQIQYRRVEEIVDGEKQVKMKFYASETKTMAGNRIVPMNEELYQLFQEQRKVWLQIDKDSDFEVDGYKNFVFVSPVTGRCMRHTSIRTMLERIVKMNETREVQLPHISPHILRHTRCSRWAEMGMDIKILQYLMGQSDIRITMGVYNHVDISRIKREMLKVEGL